MKRIDATSSNPDLLTSAFEDGPKATLITVNRSTEPQILNVTGADHNWKQIERTNPYSENSTSTSVPTQIVVQSGEIVTLSTIVVN